MRPHVLVAIAVCGGAILVGSSLGIVQAQGPRPDRHGPRNANRGPSDEEKETIRLKIGITKDQEAKIEALHTETDQKLNDVMAKTRDLYKQLTALYDSYDFDRNQARNLRQQLTALHRRMLDIHADNEEKLRRILSRDQFEKLRQLLKEYWEKTRQERAQRAPAPAPRG